MVDYLNDLTSVVLAKSLDAAGARHKVIADNIANVETPGFTRSKVSFDEQLKSALASGDDDSTKDRVSEMEPEVELDEASPRGPNGNNVNIDIEMAELNKNNLQYDSLVQLLNLRGSMIKIAIREGR